MVGDILAIIFSPIVGNLEVSLNSSSWIDLYIVFNIWSCHIIQVIKESNLHK